jgi:hypothetical protein
MLPGSGCRQEQARPMRCQPTLCFRQSPECADASRCWRAAPGRDRHSSVLLGGVTALCVDAFVWLTSLTHPRLGTSASTWGIFDQGVWLLSRFQTPL